MKTENNKPQRAGFTWVEDRTVKGGGFWRKLPKGGRIAGGLIAGGLIAAAAIGTGAALLASRNKKTVLLQTPADVVEALLPEPKAEENQKKWEHLGKPGEHQTQVAVENKNANENPSEPENISEKIANSKLEPQLYIKTAALGKRGIHTRKIINDENEQPDENTTMTGDVLGMNKDGHKIIVDDILDPYNPGVLIHRKNGKLLLSIAGVHSPRLSERQGRKQHINFKWEMGDNEENEKMARGVAASFLRGMAGGDKSLESLIAQEVDHVGADGFKANLSNIQAFTQATKASVSNGKNANSQGRIEKMSEASKNQQLEQIASELQNNSLPRSWAHNGKTETDGLLLAVTPYLDEKDRLNRVGAWRGLAFNAEGNTKQDSMKSTHYNAGRAEALINTIPGLMPVEYIQGRMDVKQERESNRPTRPGFSWVEDHRVKGGGYWRKLPNGGRLSDQEQHPPNPSRPKSSGHLAAIALTAALGGAAVGVSAAVVALHFQRQAAVEKATEAANQEIEQLKKTANATVGQTAAAYKSELETVSSKLAETETTLAQTVTQLEQANARSKNHETKLAEQTELITNLQGQLTQSGQELGETQKKEQLASQKHLKAKELLAQKQTDLKAANDGLETTRKELGASHQKVQELSSHVDKLNQERAELTQSLEGLQTEVNTHKQSQKQLTEKIGQLNSEVESRVKEREKLKSDRQQLTQQVTELQQQSDQHKKERDETRKQLADLQSTSESRIQEGIAQERTRLEKEKTQAIAEIDQKHTHRATQEIEAAQRKFDRDIEAAKDPAPGAGKKKTTGDVLTTPDGSIALGATERWGSAFSSLTTSEQKAKIGSASDKLVDDAHNRALKELQSGFVASIKEIDTRRQIDPEDKLPSDEVSTDPIQLNARLAAKPKSAVEKHAQEEYNPRVLKGKTKVETSKEQQKRITGHLIKLRELEQTVVLQQLREDTLRDKVKQVKQEAKAAHLEALEKLHNSAKNQDGEYTPSLLTPEALKAFDKTSKTITRKAKTQVTKAYSDVLSPKFAEQTFQDRKKFLDEVPDGVSFQKRDSRLDKKDDKNKPTKAGFTWVEDQSVKGGGYWRKLPKGTKLGAVITAPTTVAAGAALLASRKPTGFLREQLVNAEKAVLPEKKGLTKGQKIALGVSGAAAVAGTGAAIIVAHRKQKQQQEQEQEEERYRILEEMSNTWRNWKEEMEQREQQKAGSNQAEPESPQAKTAIQKPIYPGLNRRDNRNSIHYELGRREAMLLISGKSKKKTTRY